MDGQKLLRETVKALTQNYPVLPYQMTGFYRERLADTAGTLQTVEAVLAMQSDGYQQRTRTPPLFKAYVVKARRRMNARAEGLDTLPLRNGANAMVLQADYVHTIAKNPDIELSKLRYFRASVLETIDWNGRSVHVLECVHPEKRLAFKLRFYIDTETKAVVRHEFQQSGEAYRHNPEFKHQKVALVKSSTQYQWQRGRWWFAQSNYEMRMMDTRNKKDYTITAAYVTTEFGRVPKMVSDSVQRDQVFPLNMGRYDPAFWERYNYIREGEDD